MEEPIKFTDEEMTKLKKLQDDFNNLVLQFGQLNIEKLNLDRTTRRLEEVKEKLDDDYKLLIKSESALSTELNVKYGDGVLDPRTGIFKPTPKVNQ